MPTLMGWRLGLIGLAAAVVLASAWKVVEIVLTIWWVRSTGREYAQDVRLQISDHQLVDLRLLYSRYDPPFYVWRYAQRVQARLKGCGDDSRPVNIWAGIKVRGTRIAAEHLFRTVALLILQYIVIAVSILAGMPTLASIVAVMVILTVSLTVLSFFVSRLYFGIDAPEAHADLSFQVSDPCPQKATLRDDDALLRRQVLELLAILALLVVGFALAYYGIDASMPAAFVGAPKGLLASLLFAASTTATIDYDGMIPAHDAVHFVIVVQVFAGLLALVTLPLLFGPRPTAPEGGTESEANR